MKSINFLSAQLIKEKGSLYNIPSKTVDSPAFSVSLVNEILELNKKTKEYFAIFALDEYSRLIGTHIVHIGTLNASLVHPRETYQAALLMNAKKIIAFHNHPSGSVYPSKEDEEVTTKLMQVGEILDCKLVDHIILGWDTDNYYSMKENYHFF